MPAYTFEIRWAGGEQNSWTYFPTDESARNYARLLAENFKAGGQYRSSAQLVVKNGKGEAIASIQF